MKAIFELILLLIYIDESSRSLFPLNYVQSTGLKWMFLVVTEPKNFKN